MRVITDVPSLLEIVRTTKEWPRRTRNMSAFKTDVVGNVVILNCTNRVEFYPEAGQPTTNTYTETWVLQRDGSGLKALLSHYSKVIATEHTEDVQQVERK